MHKCDLTSGQQLRGDEKMEEENNNIEYEAADHQSQKDEIIEMNDKPSTHIKEVSRESTRNKVINWFKRFGYAINKVYNKEEYGKVIILLGQKKTGKSETIKTLCKEISGDKHIVKFDEKFLPTKIADDERKDWRKIPGCKLIENEKQLCDASGNFIFEDFPCLDEECIKLIYNKIKDSRHDGYLANYFIIAHSYKVIKGTVLDFANAILIYRDAPIKPQQIGARLGNLGHGHAIDRAKNELKEYHYLFVSLDNKKWCNPSINSRDVSILKKILKNKLKEDELKEIHYPKKSDKLVKPKKETKREIIEQMFKDGFEQEDILNSVKTTSGYIWKVKVYMKKRYVKDNGIDNLPYYLEDNRKKKQQKKEIVMDLSEEIDFS
jgi:hypothetical protein